MSSVSRWRVSCQALYYFPLLFQAGGQEKKKKKGVIKDVLAGLVGFALVL